MSSGSCFYGWENLNFVTDTVAGWDTACNGNPTLTWSQMQAAFGSQAATEIDLIEDGGWNTPRGRDITVDNFMVNNFVMNGANVH